MSGLDETENEFCYEEVIRNDMHIQKGPEGYPSAQAKGCV